jgi:hypothetical protein
MTPSKAPIPFLGTWKLTKCETSHPDLPHPTSGTTTFTQGQDGAIHYSNDGVWSDGRTPKVTADIQLDGTWCPITGSLVTDSVSFRHLGDGSLEVRMRKGGADVGTNRSTYSADGRTMTGHWQFSGPGGSVITWTTTSERQ